MVIRKSLDQNGIDEITWHLSLTAWTMVKAYTLEQISFIDWIDTRTVKRSGKYIPVRLDLRDMRYWYNIGRYKKPYTIKWIRVDEIKHIYNKRNSKKRLEEEPI